MRETREQLQCDLLVLGCREGDAAAFEALVSLWQERLWRHASRLTGDGDAAYDILQESWLVIGRKINTLLDPVAFPAWAYRIVSNKSNDWLRRACRHHKRHEAYAEMWATNSGTPTHDEDDRCESLRQALDRLSSQDLALLALKYDEGFDSSQISEALNIPEGTVRSRLHYIRNRIRDLMKENES